MPNLEKVIFQRDYLFPLIFIIALIARQRIWWNYGGRYFILLYEKVKPSIAHLKPIVCKIKPLFNLDFEMLLWIHTM